jgi:1-phosphatidylinositol-3-phosphate 5-kinase
VSPLSSDQLRIVQVNKQIQRGETSLVLSLENELATAMDGCGTLKRAPTPPPKEKDEKQRKAKEDKGSVIVVTQNMKELPATPSRLSIHQPTPSTSSFAGTIANSINTAMRYVLNHPDSKSPSVHPPPVPKKQHHNLLLVDLNNIDERPHIKYDWTIGRRLKFSCTVYYARQFELMRKRCGVDDTYLKSLERSINWAAVGGKSRSDFWKTTDEKFIIKTLVNAWNVADL